MSKTTLDADEILAKARARLSSRDTEIQPSGHLVKLPIC